MDRTGADGTGWECSRPCAVVRPQAADSLVIGLAGLPGIGYSLPRHDSDVGVPCIHIMGAVGLRRWRRLGWHRWRWSTRGQWRKRRRKRKRRRWRKRRRKRKRRRRRKRR